METEVSRPRPFRGVVLGLLVAAATGFAPVAEAAPSAAARCSYAKSRAVVAAYACLVEESNNGLRGETSDPARCSTALAAAFTKAESGGACPTTGDDAIGFAAAESAQARTLETLQAEFATEPAQVTCVARKNKASAQYAACISRTLWRRIAQPDSYRRAGFDVCLKQMRERTWDLEGCFTENDEGNIATAMSRAGAYYPGARFLNTELRYPFLVGADFRGADFSGTRLIYCNLSEADLTGATLTDSYVLFTRMDDANMSGGTFDGAALNSSSMRRTNLDGASLAGALPNQLRAVSLPVCPASLPPGWICTGGFLVGPIAWLVDEDLHGLDLTAASLEDAYLAGANLSGANLSGVNARSAEMVGANLSGADLSGADLTYIRAFSLAGCPAALDAPWVCTANAILGPSVNLYDADLSGSDLSGIDFTDANFYSANINGVNFAGATLVGNSWLDATCPDGSVASSFSGSTATCCGHHIGAPPAMCE